MKSVNNTKRPVDFDNRAESISFDFQANLDVNRVINYSKVIVNSDIQ